MHEMLRVAKDSVLLFKSMAGRAFRFASGARDAALLTQANEA